MATNNGKVVDTSMVKVGMVEFTQEQIDAMGPVAWKMIQDTMGKRANIQDVVNTVSDHIDALINLQFDYDRKFAELGEAMRELKDAGGTLSDVPEYVRYRHAHNQLVSAKGKPTNMAVVIQFYADAKASILAGESE